MLATHTALELATNSLVLPLLLFGAVIGACWRAVVRILFGTVVALALVGLVVVLTA